MSTALLPHLAADEQTLHVTAALQDGWESP